MPVEPPASPWVFPDVSRLGGADDLVAVGGDLEPGTLLTAYRSGLFPMPLDPEAGGPDIGWWSPEPRAVLPVDGLRMSRSLRRSCRAFEIRVDTAFDEVVAACADDRRDDPWITADIRTAYGTLHRLGWAHSVEAWTTGPEPALAGGLYGVAVGALFAGESMFHRATDASKVALVGLVAILAGGPGALLDVQWRTEHLASLGTVELRRRAYLDRLAEAVTRPLPPAFAGLPPLSSK